MRQLSVSGLHKAFGTHPVLTGLDLDVPAGAFTAILGPSGSGKTTLLRLLAGFERADAGTITIGDRVVDGPGGYVPPERRKIGYVPQEGALFPHLTVAGNIGFGLPGRERRGPRIAELLDAVGLTGMGKPVPASAVRRPAAARRAGPRAGHPAGGGAARRAVRLTRRPHAGERPRRRAADLPDSGNDGHPRHP